MRSLLVIELPPLLDEDLRFRPTSELLPIQQLITQLAVEALHKTVLPRTAWRNIDRSDILVPQLTHNFGCRELDPVFRSDIGRLAIHAHQPRQSQNDVLRTQAGSGLDREAFPGVFINHAQHLQGPSIDQLDMHEVIAPFGVGTKSARQADITAGTPPARPSAGYVQAQRPPHPPNPGIAQTQPGCHPAVAEAWNALGSRQQLFAHHLDLVRLHQLVSVHTSATAQISADLVLRESPAGRDLERFAPTRRGGHFFG